MMCASGNLTTAVGFIYGGSKIANQLRDTEVSQYGLFPHPLEPDRLLYPNCQWFGISPYIDEACPVSGGKIIIAMFTIMCVPIPFTLYQRSSSPCSRLRGSPVCGLFFFKCVARVDRMECVVAGMGCAGMIVEGRVASGDG